MLYNPLLQLFLKSCATWFVYQTWRKNLKKAEYFSTTEPYMSLTLHYISGDLTMKSLQTVFFSPSRARWRGYCTRTVGGFGMDCAGGKDGLH